MGPLKCPPHIIKDLVILKILFSQALIALKQL